MPPLLLLAAHLPTQYSFKVGGIGKDKEIERERERERVREKMKGKERLPTFDEEPVGYSTWTTEGVGKGER